jgi:hypothetical protein
VSLTKHREQSRQASGVKKTSRILGKKMTTEDDSIEATLHKELECIKADMDGRMNNTPPRRHKKIRKI